MIKIVPLLIFKSIDSATKSWSREWSKYHNFYDTAVYYLYSYKDFALIIIVAIRVIPIYHSWVLFYFQFKEICKYSLSEINTLFLKFSYWLKHCYLNIKM